MPGYDGTGPQGTGPFGRGMGPCGQGTRSARGGFFGLRRGFRGGGCGFRWFPRFGVADEKTALDSERQWLTEQLDAIKQRLNEIEEK